MTDVPPGGYPPPPPPRGYPPPPPPGAYPYPQPYQQPYQQQGYGWSQGAAAPFAGFWARLAAALIDGVIFSVPINILVAAAPDAQVAIQLLGFAAGVVYYTVLEGGPQGQTIGKKALSIRVVDVATSQPGIGAGRALGRYFARMLSAIPCGLGYFWMLWDPRKQTWHDKLVRTFVVKG
jgi:uncharacterized RDD family membrane protein YckC